jgi:phosphatidylglycerophosphate synthase
MSDAPLTVVPIGGNDTPIWGMSALERLRRIAGANGLAIGSRGDGPALLVDLGYAFDPAWVRIMKGRPGFAVTRGGVPVIAHVTPEQPDPARLAIIVQEEAEIENHALRKRERPFMERLTPANVPGIERASYLGSYKGVTDVLTKYLWPEWAFHLTRLSARWGLSPNQITGIGAVFCVIATLAFWYGFYWIGLAAGLVMMVLDTVDGKLARCTITSSWWGNVFDHGMDLIHPPFWWYAWGVGLAAYGRPLPADIFWACMAAIVGGYVVQRLIEGGFIGLFGIHIHVWRRIDSQFRLITARRNPNMPILAAFLAIGRPDWGLEAVAIWTIVSLAVHLLQLVQALIARAMGRPIVSWLA